MILILPIPTIWNLNLSLRRKAAVLCMLSFGVSSVVIAFCRFIVLYNFLHSRDISWVVGEMVIVAELEINCAIVAVNLPSMGALFSTFGAHSTTVESGSAWESGREGRRKINGKTKTYEMSTARKEKEEAQFGRPSGGHRHQQSG